MKHGRIDPVVGEFAARARRALGSDLVKIYWFGSRARGDAVAHSDYDLLLETRSAVSEAERDMIADVAVDISADCGVLLDIHYRTSEAVANGVGKSAFIESILAEAIAA